MAATQGARSIDETVSERWKESWNDKESLNWMSYIQFNLKPMDALAFSNLLFPTFIEIGRFVLIREFWDPSTEMPEKSSMEDDIEFYKSMTRVQLFDLFSDNGESLGREYEILSQIIKLTWAISLEKIFSGRAFEVETYSSETDCGPIVQFYELFDRDADQ